MLKIKASSAKRGERCFKRALKPYGEPMRWGNVSRIFFQMVGTWVHKLNFVEAKDPGKKDFEAEQKCFSRLKEMNYSIILESLKFRSGRRGWHVRPAGGFQNCPQFRWVSKEVKQNHWGSPLWSTGTIKSSTECKIWHISASHRHSSVYDLGTEGRAMGKVLVTLYANLSSDPSTHRRSQ